MINKIFKIVNNKFSRFFKFVFFIRYLFAIFFVAIVLFLIIPQFFDYKKKEKIISFYLFENYGLEVKKIGEISYHFFPVPFLKINNFHSNLFSENTNLKTKNVIIYPKLFSIYNYKNFKVRKIKFEDNEIKTSANDLKFLIDKILKIKNKLSFKNLNLNIEDGDANIINFDKVSFFNYGYKKNDIEGIVFNKKFKLKISDDFSNLNLKIFDTGIILYLDIPNRIRDEYYNGSLKGKVLNSNFKLNFLYDENSLKIEDFIFRGKKLSFDSAGVLELNPFFSLNLNSKIINIDFKFLKELDIEKILNKKRLIKKLNIENNLSITSKKFGSSPLKNLNIKKKIAYGRVDMLKNFNIFDSSFNCSSNINLLEEFPIFYFNCNVNIKDKMKFLKKIGIYYKLRNETVNLSVLGNLNILNRKINFDNIIVDDEKFNKEDLKYYKDSFEKILFDEDFMSIFNLSKIRKYILEIS